MIETLTFLTGCAILFGVGYAGFLFGRERAESQAAATIADLRRASLVLRRQRDRAVENNSRLARYLALTTPPEPTVPEWITK